MISILIYLSPCQQMCHYLVLLNTLLNRFDVHQIDYFIKCILSKESLFKTAVGHRNVVIKICVSIVYHCKGWQLFIMGTKIKRVALCDILSYKLSCIIIS